MAEAGISVDDTEKTITLTGQTYNLDEIWADANVGNDNLTNFTDGTWRLNYSLIVDGDAGLELSPTAGPTGCTWLKLATKNESGKENAYIKINGDAWFNDTIVSSWIFADDDYNYEGEGDFRPYILVIPEDAGDTPSLKMKNTSIRYLGFDEDDKRGVTYEVDNIEEALVQSTGYAHNCTFWENYIAMTFSACDNMYITDSAFNHSYEAAIVLTTSDNVAPRSSHNCYVGSDETYTTGVDGQFAKVYINNTCSRLGASGIGDGIRMVSANNFTGEDIEINDVDDIGLRLSTNCNNHTWTNLITYDCGDSSTDYHIFVDTCTNISFTDSTAYSAGTTGYGNWRVEDSSYVNTTRCRGWGSSYSDMYFGTCDHCTLINNTLNNSLNGMYFYKGHNNTITDCVSHNHSNVDLILLGSPWNTIVRGFFNDSLYGIKIYDVSSEFSSDYNSVTLSEVNGQDTVGISIGLEGEDHTPDHNTITATIVGESDSIGLGIYSSSANNTITTTTISDCVGSNGKGIHIDDNATYNEILYTTVSNCNDNIYVDGWANHNWVNSSSANLSIATGSGLCLSGAYIHNNSFNNDYFCTNGWGLWAWAGVTNTNVYNYIEDCHFTDNTQAGLDIGRVTGPLYITDCVITGNTGNGAEIRSGANVDFTRTYSYTNGLYDFIFENDTTVDYIGSYILDGGDTEITNTIGATYADNAVDHDPGDGLWNIMTRQIISRISVGTGNFIMSAWSPPSLIRWTVSATNGAVYTKVGGLTDATTYRKYIGSNYEGTYRSHADTMLNSTYIAWFNYSGGWSTKLFKLTTVAESTGTGGDTGGGTGGNDLIIHVMSGGSNVAGATVSIYSSSGALVDVGTTGSNGMYTASLSDGNYQITVTASGYRVTEQSVVVSGDTSTIIELLATELLNIWVIIGAIIIIAIIIFVYLYYTKWS